MRRVVLLLGRWTDIVPREMRAELVRRAIVPALGDRDVLVRLAAADALALAIAHHDLPAAEVADLVAPMCQQLLALIAGVSELDLNCHLLKCLKGVIERLESHIRPAAALIAQALPALWERGSGVDDLDQQTLMRQSVIRIMSTLVGALGADSVGLHALAMPVLHYCLNSDEDGEAGNIKDSFLEEALDLWSQVVANAPALTPELEALFAHWFPLAAFNTSLIGPLMSVLRSYALFNTSAFMERHAARINRLVADLLADSTDNSVPHLMPAVEVLFTLYPAQAPAAFGDITQTLVKELLASQSAVAAERTQLSERSLALYVRAVCRMCVVNLPAMARIWQAFAQQAQRDAVPVLLEAVFAHLDCVREVYHQKTVALALAQFVAAPSELRPEHLPAFATRIIDVVNSTLTELFSDRAATRVPQFSAADFPADAAQWTEGHRVQRMIMQDAVTAVDLKAFVLQKLGECQQTLGAERFAQVMASIDPFVLEQLQAAPSQ